MNRETILTDFLSIGSKFFGQRVRGRSCYRFSQTISRSQQNEVPMFSEGGLRLYPLRELTPTMNQWPTPNAVEFVMSFLREEDDPTNWQSLWKRCALGSTITMNGLHCLHHYFS
jgi:hypothetical protein